MPASEKLDALRQRAAKLQARIDAAEAKEKSRKRKDDTRLKVLIGAAFLSDSDHRPDTRPLIVDTLKRAITAPKDRQFLKDQGWL